MEIVDYNLFVNNYQQYQMKYCGIYDVEIGENLKNVILSTKHKDENYEYYREYYEKCTQFLMSVTKPHEKKSGYQSEYGWKCTLNENDKYTLSPVFTTQIEGEDALYDFSYFPANPFYLVREKNEKFFEIAFVFHLKYWVSSPEYLQTFIKYQIKQNFNNDCSFFKIFITGILSKYRQIISKDLIRMFYSGLHNIQSELKRDNNRLLEFNELEDLNETIHNQKSEIIDLKKRNQLIENKLQNKKDDIRTRIFIRYLMNLKLTDNCSSYVIAAFVEQLINPKDPNSLNKEVLKRAGNNSTYNYLFRNLENTNTVNNVLEEIEDISLILGQENFNSKFRNTLYQDKI